MPRRSGPKLQVIAAAPASAVPTPPWKLGAVGLSLWSDITASYEFGDRASYETLAQACAAADRAERCREQIDADGEVIRTKAGPRDHPLLKHEITARSFVVRTLARLGLDLEPVRAVAGRPPSGGIGMSWKDLRAD
jgi:Phage terminase, small subunit